MAKAKRAAPRKSHQRTQTGKYRKSRTDKRTSTRRKR